MDNPQDLIVAARAAQARSAELRLRSEQVLQQADHVLATLASNDAGAQWQQLRAEVEGLRLALESRAVIEQAKGVLVATVGCDPDAAFELLRRQSQHENRKLRDVASELVALHVRRRSADLGPATKAPTAPPR